VAVEIDRTSKEKARSRVNSPRGVHGQVLSDLGTQIVSGEIPPGEVLPREQVLREQYGVSRTLLREVFRVLQAKGLVEPRQGMGTQVLPRNHWKFLDEDVLGWMSVKGADSGFVQDLEEVRRIVEPSAARLAALRAEPEHLERMADALERMTNFAADLTKFSTADADFHAAILDAAQNAVLRETAGSIVRAMAVRNAAVLRTSPAPLATIKEHREIYAAIAARDSDRAFEMMTALLHQSEMLQIVRGPRATVKAPAKKAAKAR
jgi:DNA-binding FadR family transcriptional regulator